VHRIARWRRQIGVDRHLFAPLPIWPRSHTRFRRVTAKIVAEENALIGHLGCVCSDLERRIRSRKAKGKW
jgi:hypothetical protein